MIGLKDHVYTAVVLCKLENVLKFSLAIFMINEDIFDVINPLMAKGFPIDE